MTRTPNPPDSQTDDGRLIDDEVTRRSRDRQLPCAVAFDIAASLNISAAAVGEAADRTGIRLTKCQLGLFGYQPQKKIVKPAAAVTDSLRSVISAESHDGRLPCETVWRIAVESNLQKMAVAGACETLGVKIKPCQLGAF